ncbi:acyl-CoA dehydrogenase family protein [Nocardia sp. CA2R105]|nr:acyl-CoA dehydrogenase family protein [Nocardia coffeae]
MCLGIAVPEIYDGGSTADFRFRMVRMKELCRVGANSFNAGTSVQDNLVIPYPVDLGSDEQKQTWLPRLCAGTAIGSLVLTEPGAGSDPRQARAHVDRGYFPGGRTCSDRVGHRGESGCLSVRACGSGMRRSGSTQATGSITWQGVPKIAYGVGVKSLAAVGRRVVVAVAAWAGEVQSRPPLTMCGLHVARLPSGAAGLPRQPSEEGLSPPFEPSAPQAARLFLPDSDHRQR